MDQKNVQGKGQESVVRVATNVLFLYSAYAVGLAPRLFEITISDTLGNGFLRDENTQVIENHYVF